MKSGDRLFLMTFISAIAIMFFFIETSISGYVIPTTGIYCEYGVCQGFCYFDEECPRTEICCSKLDFGICKSRASCITPYETSPIAKFPIIDHPAPGRRNMLSLYLSIILTILVLGVFYHSSKRRHLETW